METHEDRLVKLLKEQEQVNEKSKEFKKIQRKIDRMEILELLRDIK